MAGETLPNYELLISQYFGHNVEDRVSAFQPARVSDYSYYFSTLNSKSRQGRIFGADGGKVASMSEDLEMPSFGSRI